MWFSTRYGKTLPPLYSHRARITGEAAPHAGFSFTRRETGRILAYQTCVLWQGFYHNEKESSPVV